VRADERFPRALIPLACGDGDVRDVDAFADELLKELVESIHGSQKVLSDLTVSTCSC
jgi:hypothetical protein